MDKTKISRAFGKLGLSIKRHSPEILVGAGIVGVVTSAILACKATPKAAALVEETKRNTRAIQNWREHAELVPADYTDEHAKKDIMIVRSQTGLALAKAYAPAVTLGALSITCILAGANILHKRNVGLTAAYTAIDSSFKDYRKRVVERFGADLDKELRYNIVSKEVEETVVDEKGKEKTVTKTINVVDLNEPSDYARFYDVGCNGWQKDPEHNLWFLRLQQNYANEKLKAKGYLFLNEVYEMLGIPITKAGAQVGWILDESNKEIDNYVDFGIYNINRPENRDFVNGYERTILLDFNVDGPILDRIERIKQR